MLVKSVFVVAFLALSAAAAPVPVGTNVARDGPKSQPLARAEGYQIDDTGDSYRNGKRTAQDTSSSGLLVRADGFQLDDDSNTNRNGK